MAAPTASKPRKKAVKKTAAPRKKASSVKELNDAIRPPAVPVYDDDKITPASDWTPSVGPGMVIELPSGRYAKMQRTLNLPTLLSSGQVPNPLGDIIRDMIKSGETDLKIDPEDHEVVEQAALMIRGQAKLIFISPRLEECPDGWDVSKQGLWSPSPGAVDINMLDFADLMYAFTWAQGAALTAAQFREATDKGMAGLQHEQGVESDPGATDGADE